MIWDIDIITHSQVLVSTNFASFYHLQIGFNNGVPIDEKFFVANIAGKHNSEIAQVLFPDDVSRGLKFCDEKEALYRK